MSVILTAPDSPKMRVALRRVVPLMWILGAGLIGIGAVAGGVDLNRAVDGLPWQILAIYLALEMFTSMLAESGALDLLAVKAATVSKGHPGRLMAVFAAALMVVGTVNNNLTSILVVLPAILILLRSLKVNSVYIGAFFGLILAISNCAGAATPVGDFPALLIIGSGITSFKAYLFLAFPLFAFTALVLVMLYRMMCARKVDNDGVDVKLAVDVLEARHRHDRVNRPALTRLAIVFAGMVVCWLLLPAGHYPTAAIAWLGVAVAAAAVAPTGVRPRFETFNLDPLLRITAAMFVASLASASGSINQLAHWLGHNITDPTMLLLAVMVCTTVLCGLFEAGSTAAAMLPLLALLTAPQAPLAPVRDIAVVAFAASICAGSSMFITSATAGQLLATKVNEADLITEDGRPFKWGWLPYVRWGLLNWAVQFAIAVVWMLAAVTISGGLR